jgi:hypothetical protein
MQAAMQAAMLNRAIMRVAETTEVSARVTTGSIEPTEWPLLEKAIPITAAEPKKVKPICEPEQRLWKLSAQAVSPKVARIELFALILFLTIALVGVVSCFAELFQLLDNDAIGWMARKAIGGR